MFGFIAILLCFASVSFTHHNQYQYCLCGHDFIYDPEREYNTSSMFDLQNACYLCEVNNETATFFYSGSLPYLGYLTCDEPGALEARTAKCNEKGGTVVGCITTEGVNQSQSTGCGPLVNSPTNDASNLMGTTFLMTVATGILYLFS